MARVSISDATRLGIQNSTYTYAIDAEASDSYAITLTPAPTAYAQGQVFYFKANTANTGIASLNVNALGAKTIKKLHDQTLATGDIEAGQIVGVAYDGTDFQMISDSDIPVTDPQFTTIELGHATDTTISRVSAGVVAVEGDKIMTVAGTDTVSGVKSFNDGTVKLNGSTSGTMTIKAPAVASTYVQTYPPATGTVHTSGSANNFGAFTAYFTETDNGNSSTADTIDWGLSNKQKSTLTGNCTFTFTAPAGPCSLILKLVQDATGSRTVTWPATVHWSGGTAPTLTTTASKVDIISFYYDGTTYFGNSTLNFTA